MDEFARVFFHVRAGDADRGLLPVHFHVEMTVLTDRQVILGSLEIFGRSG